MNSPTSSNKKRKRPSRPIDPADKRLRLNYFSQSFQVRYGIWLATIGAFCFSLMGLLIHLSIKHAVQDSPQSGPVHDALTAFLSPKAIFLSYDVLLPAGILIVFLVAVGIVGTHKIAGPLFAIKRHMNWVRRGRTRQYLRLRYGDELMDVAASLNALIQENWNFEAQIDQALLEALAQMESGRAADAAETLRSLRTKLETRRTPIREAYAQPQVPRGKAA
jgi:hypothetical protein